MRIVGQPGSSAASGAPPSSTPLIAGSGPDPISTAVFSGTAQGGSVGFAAGGVPLQVTTTTGQTAAEVAQALAAAINGALSAQGITATALGNTVTVNAAITDLAINDPGIGQGAAAAPVPVLPSWSAVLLGSLLLASTLWRRSEDVV